MPKKFAVCTLGCKVNQCESDAVSDQLRLAGWSQAEPGTPADLCIINTCTVTQKASGQSGQEIRRAVRQYPDAEIIVTGCYAQTEPDAVRGIQGVRLIVGNADKNRIPELLSDFLTDQNSPPVQIVKDICSEKQFFHTPASAFGNRTRPFVKIQDGCNAFCTYCIVPYARGKSRSLPPEDALRQLEAVRQAGYKEAVLTGIHLGSYGHDLTPRTDLLGLLRQIHDRNLTDRIRLSSLEPKEITDDLIRFVADAGSICRHFHIPLQSGDNDILKRMHRPYDREFFRERVLQIHDRIPDAAVGADILVGFPGETDAAFENTRSLIDQLPVTYLHVFPFSPRKGTPAFAYPDKVSRPVVRERCKILRQTGYRKKNNFYQNQIGRKTDILIESGDASSGLLKGVSSNYIPVFISGGNHLKNTVVTVTIEKVTNNNRVFGTMMRS